MCGIAGVVNTKNVRKEDVEKMIATIRYRGPDEAGAEVIGPSIMGHARLAVVDPENGFQPMSNTDDTVWVVFNGEIYNYVEIREDLKKKGYKFKSRCDTEVLVHLWREKGEAMLADLIGMYAFFIWDTKRNCGILARDRVGIKPLFIAPHDGGYAYASEMKAILSLPGFKKEVNVEALIQTHAFNYCPPPQTCFKNIRHLEPGTYLKFEPNKEPTQHTYWKWPLLQEREKPSFDQFEALMDDAVRMQMRFDVDGGMYLSGGIDSSITAKHLTKQWKHPKIEAVSLDFNEKEYSEYDYAERAAKTLGIELEKATIDKSMIPQIVDKVVYHAEQPHGDFSFNLFYILARKAHEQGKIVMFTGDGPDEALFGFNHNVNFFHENNRMNFSLQSYFEVINYMPDAQLKEIFSPEVFSKVQSPMDKFEDILDPWRDLDPIEQIIAYECTSLMPGNNLVKGDRMAACWSIEGRSPFLDHRVIELFTRLPLQDKVSLGVGKRYLKQYAERYYSQDFIYGKKRMPTTPIGVWLQNDLYGWAKDILASTPNDIINTKVAVKLLDDHKAGKANNTRALRTLIMTSIWLKNYF
jgi:asparagine synthase (glutamine-hydrolysing)